MARLVIGHTTDKSSRIWVRGDASYPWAFVVVVGESYRKEIKIETSAKSNYCATATFAGLDPETQYSTYVTFGSTRSTREPLRVTYGGTHGTFKTFPDPVEMAPLTLLLGSCNLHSMSDSGASDRAFGEIMKISESREVDFAVHCGDQIYYDYPNLFRGPDEKKYAASYLDAWGDSRLTREFLTRMPQYMVLDDHEIVNNFRNDKESIKGHSPKEWKTPAIKAYRDFVHLRNPQTFDDQVLYYTFQFGQYGFFVLDTRSERNHSKGQIVSPEQLDRFLSWLKRGPGLVKFVVTPVPMIGDLSDADRDDKWCSKHFVRQREKVLATILKNDLSNVVFLTGDVHSAYHASMQIEDENASVTVHELMSGPICHFSKTGYGAFESGHKYTSQDEAFNYTTTMRRSEFAKTHSNVMVVSIDQAEIRYEVIRTSDSRKRLLNGSFQVTVG